MIIEAADQLGIGGTELALENYCRYLDKSQFDLTVVGFREGGVRAAILRNLGLEVVIAGGDSQLWENLLRGADVLHWHGSGLLAADVFAPVGRAKPPLVIQTNVFGLSGDSSYYELIDYDLYISKACLIKRLSGKDGSGPLHFPKQGVLYYPVDVERLRQSLPSRQEIDQCRHDLGLSAAPTVGRVGRADDSKFHPAAIRMMPILSRWVPEVRFLLVGATPSMKRLAAKLGVQDRFAWVEPTADLKTLLTYYCCMDVYLGASAIGESFGMTIAEAMVCGLPVVAISTPEADNAQVELVDNGVNGLVVEAYPRLVALACKELLINKERRGEMAQAGLQKVQAYAAAPITRGLENLIYTKLRPMTKGGKQISNDNQMPIWWSPEMASDYRRRLSDVFARPRLADRLEVWAWQYGGRLKLKLSAWWKEDSAGSKQKFQRSE